MRTSGSKVAGSMVGGAALVVLLTLGGVAAAEPAPSGSIPTPAPAPTSRASATPSGYVSGGLRLWSVDGHQLDFVGVEVGPNLGRQFAVTFDYQTNVDGGNPFVLHVLRVGLRVAILPGELSPYLGASLGMGFEGMGGDSQVVIGDAGGGLEYRAQASGLLLDLGLRRVGLAAGDGGGSLTQLALSGGKEF